METKTRISKAISQALDKLGKTGIAFKIEHPEPGFGDYATNVALGKRPEFAKKISALLQKNLITPTGIIAKIDVVRPGFINFWLSKDELISNLGRALKLGSEYGKSGEGKGKTVVVEYSSPNIAKRFGIGHLRSTIIGQSAYNLYKFLGYKTIGENHLGDWGTQFGMLLYKIQNSKLKVQNLTIDDLEQLYVEFNRDAAKNPQILEEARRWFKNLEDGDSDARKIWQAVVEISLKEFEKIYKLLGVSFDNIHGESFYEDKMPEVIEEAKRKGIATLDQGALIIRVPEIKTPLILVKSDRATTYETRDLAAIKWRMKTWKPDKIIYEVGAEQDLHFRLVFGAAELLGYNSKMQFVHLKHGLYRFAGGRMRTRLGTAVKLEEVLEEAKNRAKKIIENSETSRGLSEKEKEEVAQAVGVGAVKYFDLMHHPASDIVFDWEKIFVLEGNSAPYLQYTHARTQSVLKKALGTRQKAIEGGISEPNPEELALLRTFYKFPEVIEDAAHTYSPNLIVNFLFDLAQKYNAFYNKHRILGNDFRLALTAVTAQILKTGLELLGIQAPEKM